MTVEDEKKIYEKIAEFKNTFNLKYVKYEFEQSVVNSKAEEDYLINQEDRKN